MEKKGVKGAKLYAEDFLSDNFKEANFDVIYAKAVLHHFPDLELLFNKLKEKLKEKGQIVSYDPLQTNPLVKSIRAIYRPFQTDSEWEWPFTKETLQAFEENFNIEEMHGVLGKAQKGVVLDILPVSEKRKNKLVQKWVKEDWEANMLNKKIFNCLHVTMLLEGK
jgi:SAM-dependent methyltransferase